MMGKHRCVWRIAHGPNRQPWAGNSHINIDINIIIIALPRRRRRFSPMCNFFRKQPTSVRRAKWWGKRRVVGVRCSAGGRKLASTEHGTNKGRTLPSKQLGPSRQIEGSISTLNFFPPNRGFDFYFEFLPAKLRSDSYHTYLTYVFPPITHHHAHITTRKKQATPLTTSHFTTATDTDGTDTQTSLS